MTSEVTDLVDADLAFSKAVIEHGEEVRHRLSAEVEHQQHGAEEDGHLP